MIRLKWSVYSCITALICLLSLTAFGKQFQKPKKKHHQNLQVNFIATTTRTIKLVIGRKMNDIVLPSPKAKLSIYGRQLTYRLSDCQINAQPIYLGELMFIGGELVCAHHKDRIAVLVSVINTAALKNNPQVFKKTDHITLSKIISTGEVTPYTPPGTHNVLYENVTIGGGAKLKFFPISDMTRKNLEAQKIHYAS